MSDTDTLPVPETPTSEAPAVEAAPERPPLPDRLSTDPRSPYYVTAVLEHPIGLRYNGVERRDVEEYCISEGWIKVASGKSLDRRGKPLLIKLKGRIEPFYG